MEVISTKRNFLFIDIFFRIENSLFNLSLITIFFLLSKFLNNKSFELNMIAWSYDSPGDPG